MYNDGGGLYLFIRQYGAKEWIFRYSSPVTNQRRKQSIGTYPDTSLKEARRLASLKRDMLSQGHDPIIEMEKQRQLERSDLAERQERQRNTLKAVFLAWKRAELQNRKDKGKEIERAFEKDVFPLIGHKPIGEISRQDIKAVLERPLKRNVKRMANRLLSDLKQFFGYADDEELLTQDPTRRLVKERVGGKENVRKRYLSEKELRLLAELLPLSGLKQDYQQLIWLLLATGCRVNEILRAKWSHLDWQKRLLHIPAEHSKNTYKHDVYLSDFALQQVVALYKTKTTDWLVPNRSGSGAVTRQVLTKQVTDRQHKTMGKSRVGNNQALILPGGRWVIHDLRRTAGTLMQEKGIMPYIIKKCLNQKTDDKIIETYQRAELKQQQQEAFDKLGLFLETLFKRKSHQ
jgi:integrase